MDNGKFDLFVCIFIIEEPKDDIVGHDYLKPLKEVLRMLEINTNTYGLLSATPSPRFL